MKPVSVGERIYSYARNGDIAGLNSFDQKALVENANWRHPRNYKQTPLYTACKYGKLTAVNLLLKHGADPQLCDEFGVSSFDVACIEGRTLVVQALLAVKSSLALSPSSVVLACQEGRCSILKLLFACGASPELPLGEFTPLMAAALSNRVDVIDILMKADVSLEATTSTGESALMLAARHGKTDATHALLVHGASGSRTNLAGQMALDIAEECKQFGCIHLLRNPPKMSGLPLWRPSLHQVYPKQFKNDARNLVLLMTRLRSRDPKNFGPLWQVPNDIVKKTVFYLAESYRRGN